MAMVAMEARIVVVIRFFVLGVLRVTSLGDDFDVDSGMLSSLYAFLPLSVEVFRPFPEPPKLNALTSP